MIFSSPSIVVSSAKCFLIGCLNCKGSRNPRLSGESSACLPPLPLPEAIPIVAAVVYFFIFGPENSPT